MLSISNPIIDWFTQTIFEHKDILNGLMHVNGHKIHNKLKQLQLRQIKKTTAVAIS
jgi:hypothetical protein